MAASVVVRLACGVLLAALAIDSALAQSARPDTARSVAVTAQTVRPLAGPLAARVAAVAAERGIPGISVAVLSGDGAIQAAAFGLADVENRVPASTDTVFRLASISKPITAVIAMRLVERGVLDLDRPVGEFVAQWPDKRWPVTTRQLLGHLGGVRHYVRPDEIRSNGHHRSVPDALVTFAADPLLHEPGTRMLYSTFGYNLAGAACVAAAGSSFRDLLRDEVALVVGAGTLQIDDQDRLIANRAQGYRREGDGLVNAAPVDTSNKVPGGGLASNAVDLARFARGLVDATLLPAPVRDAMWTSGVTIAGEATGYGLGFSVGARDGRRFAMHGGAQPRVSTVLRIERETGVAVAILCNLEREATAIRGLAIELADAVAR